MDVEDYPYIVNYQCERITCSKCAMSSLTETIFPFFIVNLGKEDRKEFESAISSV